MGPYDSLREYAAAMEEQGQLMRIREMDQDRYEMTAFGYRLDDRMRSKAPAFIVERTKINDRWYDTPVISNVLNSYGTVAQALGAEGASDEEGVNYTAAVTHIMSFLDEDHRWAKIEPVFVERSAAPCKEVILTGDDADLYRFPWIRNNPADGGQYISTGAVVTDDQVIAVAACQNVVLALDLEFIHQLVDLDFDMAVGCE